MHFVIFINEECSISVIEHIYLYLYIIIKSDFFGSLTQYPSL